MKKLIWKNICRYSLDIKNSYGSFFHSTIGWAFLWLSVFNGSIHLTWDVYCKSSKIVIQNPFVKINFCHTYIFWFCKDNMNCMYYTKQWDILWRIMYSVAIYKQGEIFVITCRIYMVLYKRDVIIYDKV